MEAVKKESLRQIFPNRMKEQSVARNHWVVTCEEGTTREDLQNPLFWSHIARKLLPGDRLEVRVDDNSFFAEFYVVSTNKTWAKVYELSFHDFTKMEATEDHGYFEVKWKGPHRLWSVLKTDTKEIVIEGKQSREEAEQEKINLLKTI